jgi:TPR repeat protein
LEQFGVRKNEAEAAKYLRMAVEEGNPRTMYRYAHMLEGGRTYWLNRKVLSRMIRANDCEIFD